MARPFAKLRGQMREHDVDASYLARKLLVSRSCVSDRLNAKHPWTVDEMYQIMDMLRWPHNRMHELFPRGGTIPLPTQGGPHERIDPHE